MQSVTLRFKIGEHTLRKKMILATVPSKGDSLHYDEEESERVKRVLHLHLWPEGRVEVCLESGFRGNKISSDAEAMNYFSDQGWSIHSEEKEVE